MARTKKSDYSGTPYQKKNERILILENAIKQAISYLDTFKVAEAKAELITAWMRETNL